MASKKHYPVQRKIRLGTDLPSVATDAQVLVDREMSKINKRLYRQSRYYSVKVDIDADLPNGSVVNVYALMDTWANQKAYQLAHRMFLENSKEEMQRMSQGTKARWNDFRVASGTSFTGPTLNALGFGPGGAGTQRQTAEYVYSEVTDKAGTSHTFRWVGTGGNTYNIVDEYDKLGDTAQQPTFGETSNAYGDFSDTIADNQIAHLSGDGNLPPYDGRNMENTCWIHVATLFVDADGGGRLSSGFFTAPCGLLALTYGGGLNQTGANEKVSIEVKAGDYKGVSAPSMLE